MKRIAPYLLTLIIVFYLFGAFLPTSQFWVQLCGAFLVNVLFYDLINDKFLIRYTAPLRFLCELQIRKYLRSDFADENSEETLRRTLLRWLVPKAGISKKFLASATPEVASGLMIALQGQFQLLAQQVTFADFKELARRATLSADYREYLLRKATTQFPRTKATVKELQHSGDAPVGDDLRSISDQNFYSRLRMSEHEVVHAFSTTSQLSNDFLDALTLHSSRISAFHFYIVSPLVMSDSALWKLRHEYENPFFTIKTDQMIVDANGIPNPEFDTLRRSLRVITSLKSLLDKHLPFAIHVHFFKSAYPGVKIKLLERDRFAQLQPGALKYQNNLYRFGIEMSGGNTFDRLLSDLNDYRTSPSVVTAELNDAFIQKLQQQAVREMAKWLLMRGVSVTQLVEYEHMISAVAGAEFPSHFQIMIRSAMQLAHHAIDHFSEQDDIADERGEIVHISVGALICNGDKMLLIKKKDPFYKMQFSIVAGHVNAGESPVQAIYREVSEEVGVCVTKAKLARKVLDIFDPCRYGSKRHVWFIFACELDSLQFKPSSTEIEEVVWANETDIRKIADQLTPAARMILLGELTE